ncbi:prepilin-type N-terminal cleavage/methylation domain-containing protein [Candidatus Gottesmanbacteria bacterium]|nr:prepilin-type N-terminal cleavage/methylation domain-containing protein [Candidatus Gottesmanbacteria bacterium]
MRKGFTILELLVSMGVILLVSGGVVAAFNNFNESQRVRQAALTLKGNVRYAQNKAVSGDKPTSGCVTLQGYTVSFTGTSYSIQALCDGGLVGDSTTTSLPAGVSFVVPIPAAFTFAVLTGRNASDRTLTVSGLNYSFSVQVSAGGTVTTVGF